MSVRYCSHIWSIVLRRVVICSGLSTIMRSGTGCALVGRRVSICELTSVFIRTIMVQMRTGTMPKLKPSAPKKARQKRVIDELHNFKKGKLHSGSRKGPKVTDRKQAIAIALSEAGLTKRDEKGTAMNRTRFEAGDNLPKVKDKTGKLLQKQMRDPTLENKDKKALRSGESGEICFCRLGIILHQSAAPPESCPNLRRPSPSPTVSFSWIY